MPFEAYGDGVCEELTNVREPSVNAWIGRIKEDLVLVPFHLQMTEGVKYIEIYNFARRNWVTYDFDIVKKGLTALTDETLAALTQFSLWRKGRCGRVLEVNITCGTSGYIAETGPFLSWLEKFTKLEVDRKRLAFKREQGKRLWHQIFLYKDRAWTYDSLLSVLAEYPWRRGMVEILNAFGLSASDKDLGRVVVRLERLPTWTDVLGTEYSCFSITKRSGGERRVHAPTNWLKSLQRKLVDNYAVLIEPHPASHGFEKNRSILTNARAHGGKKYVVRIDIKDAFTSNSRLMLEGTLRRDLNDLGLSDWAIRLLVELFTYRGGLPTGAPSSPFLLNRVLAEFDKNMEKISDEAGCTYSRYADDIIISGDHSPCLIGAATSLLNLVGYRVNRKKTRVCGTGSRQMVTGLVANFRPNLPREQRRRLRAMLHSLRVGKEGSWNRSPITPERLKGLFAYCWMIDPETAQRLFGNLYIAASNETAC